MPTPQTSPPPTYKGSLAEQLITEVLAGIKTIKNKYPLAKKNPDLKKPDSKDREAIARHDIAVEEYQQAKAKHAEVIGIVDTLADAIKKGLCFISYIDKKKVITTGDLPLIAAANPFSIKFFMGSAFEGLLNDVERINSDPENFHPMYADVLELLANVLQKAPENYDAFAPFINPEVASAFVSGLSIQDNYKFWLGKLKDNSAVLLAQYKGSLVKTWSCGEEKGDEPDIDECPKSSRISAEGAPPLTPAAISPSSAVEEKQAAVEQAALVPASQAVAEPPVLFVNEEKDSFVEMIATTKAMLVMQQDLARAAQQSKEGLVTESASEAAEIDQLSEELKRNAAAMVEAVIGACTEHGYLPITSEQQAAIRAFTPVEEAVNQPVVAEVLAKTKEIAGRLAEWENIIIALRALSGQIAANQGKDVKQFFSGLKVNYPKVENLDNLLDILEIKDKDAISSAYARYLSPFQKTSGEELLPIKQLLEKQVNAKIEQLSPIAEKARHAAGFHPELNRMNEAYQAKLEKLQMLRANQTIFQEAIAKKEEVSRLALAEAEKSAAVHALLEKLKLFKDNFNAFKSNHPENVLDALTTSNTQIQALRKAVMACPAGAVHEETLGWMMKECLALQVQVQEAYLEALRNKVREYDSSMQSFTSPATVEIQTRNTQKIAEMEGFLSSEILSRLRPQVTRPEGFDALLQKVRTDLATHKATNASIKASTPVKAEAKRESKEVQAQQQPKPQAVKSKPCCAFLLKVLASPTLRKIAFVVMIVSAVGIVVGGLALGGVGGVAVALGMGLLAAQITTGASAGAFALSTATFFGSRSAAHKKREIDDSYSKDAQLPAGVI